MEWSENASTFTDAIMFVDSSLEEELETYTPITILDDKLIFELVKQWLFNTGSLTNH